MTTEEHEGATERKPVEEYYPHYVDPEEVEFDYAYYECRCGWTSERKSHPRATEYERDGHSQFGRTPDCGLGNHVIVFKDGSVSKI